MSGLTNGEQVDQVVDHGMKRGAEMTHLGELDNPAKRQRLAAQAALQHAAPEQLQQQDDASKEIKMLLQLEAQKKATRPPKPAPTSGKQSMRCQVCIRAKKGGCGTEKAVYRCLRRPGGPRAASLLISTGDQKESSMSRRKAKKAHDDIIWIEIGTRVHAKYMNAWLTGTVRRIHRSKPQPYAIKLDEDHKNSQLLWAPRSAVIREGENPQEGQYVADGAYKEEESMTPEEEPASKRGQLASSLLGMTDVMQQMHPGMSKFHAVVRDAATGGVKLCRKCNQPALPGNYGFCAMHRTPRSRGSGKHENGTAAMGSGAQPLRSVALPPTLAFPGNMPAILQRALQAQAIPGPVTAGTSAATGSPFAVPSMASMGSIAPPLLPPFFPQNAEATAIPATASTAAAPSQGLATGFPMMGNIGRGAPQDLPIVYGAVEGFLPNTLQGGTATPVVAEAEAEVVPPGEAADLQVPESKAVEIPQATVANEVVADGGNSGEKNYSAELYNLNLFAQKPQNP
mmetsp:Transcript_17359/g.26030  ORF Transcript_17359/g.26030 Transcript_17359/m.26030 type:complete len:512 (+) Transcript_17359:546-2081(+)|eukprot:CAMPEP_0167742614 /NCGR_PEP_ID=MMETSP0110_2-20121227/1534_1 /TAXON_ID=629695 /ORGANISM="Gymnochlora sp., Strain CCMP2014" /LENGTH=511 /DNA_ID=CAMNT_0007626845 /DNA_START=512 /DNA_END=2047 /DNA_ORIENTATION=+